MKRNCAIENTTNPTKIQNSQILAMINDRKKNYEERKRKRRTDAWPTKTGGSS